MKINLNSILLKIEYKYNKKVFHGLMIMINKVLIDLLKKIFIFEMIFKIDFKFKIKVLNGLMMNTLNNMLIDQ